MSMFQTVKTDRAVAIRHQIHANQKVITGIVKKEVEKVLPEEGRGMCIVQDIILMSIMKGENFISAIVWKLEDEGMKNEARSFKEYVRRLVSNPNAKLRVNI